MSPDEPVMPGTAPLLPTPPPAEPHIPLPVTALSRLSDRIITPFATMVHWAWVVLVLVIFFNVIMRYAMRTNFVWAEELQWHLYGFGIMIAIAYGISEDIHVRVDVLAAKFRPETRAKIELAGFLIFLLPLFVLLLIYAVPFVQTSYDRGEISSAPGGLTHRWIIKSVLILAFSLMALAAIGQISRLIRFFQLSRMGSI